MFRIKPQNFLHTDFNSEVCLYNPVAAIQAKYGKLYSYSMMYLNRLTLSMVNRTVGVAHCTECKAFDLIRSKILFCFVFLMIFNWLAFLLLLCCVVGCNCMSHISKLNYLCVYTDCCALIHLFNLTAGTYTNTHCVAQPCINKWLFAPVPWCTMA